MGWWTLPPEVREKPCRRGHDVELSYWQDYWRCRGCDREWNAAARERAKVAPKVAPSAVREVACKRGHDVELSVWGDDGRWHCRGCQRFYAKRWRGANRDKVKANQAVQDERRRVRREAAKPSPEEKILRRLDEGSTLNTDGCREWNGKRACITWRGQVWVAYILAWYLRHGETPPGRRVAQLCGNPRCIEVCHLAALTDDERGLLKLTLNSRADRVTGCREFTGKHLVEGYGVTWHGGRSWMAHRLSWSILRGRIPTGMLIDHLCRNRRCIEPTHLRVTDSEGNNRNVGKPTDERLAAIWDHAEGVEGVLLIMG